MKFLPLKVFFSSMCVLGHLQAGTIIVDVDSNVVFTGQQGSILQLGETGTEIKVSSLTIGENVDGFQSALAVGESSYVLANNAIVLVGGHAFEPNSVVIAGGFVYGASSVAMLEGSAEGNSILAKHCSPFPNAKLLEFDA